MGHQILAVGEVLWDLLPKGKQLGGAPANFTYQCRSLGADARLVTRVGDDAMGREVLERFRLVGLPTETVQIDPELPTGTVDVALADDGQPRFTIHEHVAWDRIMADEDSLAMAARADAVCFGSLSQRSEPARTAIRSLVSATRPGALRLFDVNLRPPLRGSPSHRRLADAGQCPQAQRSRVARTDGDVRPLRERAGVDGGTGRPLRAGAGGPDARGPRRFVTGRRRLVRSSGTARRGERHHRCRRRLHRGPGCRVSRRTTS